MSLTIYRADGTAKETDYLATPAALDPWHVVGAAGEPAFENGWVNFGGGLSTVAFRKDPEGRVWLRGQAKSGTAGTVLFTLPAGYRPPARVDFDTIDGTGSPTYALTTAGSIVTNAAAGNVRVTLDGLSFDTETVSQWTVPVGVPTAIPPEVKFYGEGGQTADVPTPNWDVTHTDGSPVSILLTPTIDCWWVTSCNALAKTTSAVWCRLQLNLTLSPADVDGHSVANGSILHNSGASDWNSGNVQRSWKLAKGTAYTLKLNVTPVGGTFQMYRSNTHLWLAHDGIRAR